jgi:hypothetical protein
MSAPIPTNGEFLQLLSSAVEQSKESILIIETELNHSGPRIQQGILDGGIKLLQKPFTPSSLARKVREVLDAPA